MKEITVFLRLLFEWCLVSSPIVAAAPLLSGNTDAIPRNSDSAVDSEWLRLHALIKPQPGEAQWQTIPWLTDLQEARKKAAQEGKPLFVWSAMADPIGCT